MSRLKNLILLSIVSIVALVCVEVGYRFYLEHRLHEIAEAEVKPEVDPSFGFYAYPAPWKFDLAQGFSFNAGPWVAGSIEEGAFTRCSIANRGNNFGNVGKDNDNYDTADVKIMLLGSSYTIVRNKDGDLVHNLLQQHLSERLDKRVSIINFSRDSTGLLTVFDIAREKLEELKPDLLLFVFNGTMLAYQRHWRILAPVAPGYRHLVLSLDPVPEIRNPDRVVLMPQIVSDRVDMAWCDRLKEASQRGDEGMLRNDPIVKELISARQRLQRDMNRPIFDVDHWTLKRSYVFNFLSRGDPYHEIQVFKERTVYGPHAYWSFGEDDQWVKAVSYIKESGVPFLLAHVPTLPEMVEGQPPGTFVFGRAGVPIDRGASLAESVEELTGQEIIHLYDYYEDQFKEDPVKLVTSERNWHPSPYGTLAMSRALEALLLDRPDTRALLGLPKKTAASN